MVCYYYYYYHFTFPGVTTNSTHYHDYTSVFHYHKTMMDDYCFQPDQIISMVLLNVSQCDTTQPSQIVYH